MGIASKWVLVSGASTGIGRSTALLLAQRGYGVLAGYRREADADALREQARALSLGDRLVPIRLDVTSEADIAAAKARVESLAREGGKLVALVNNAGFLIFGPVETLPLSEWRRQFDTNFFGAIALTQALLPALLDTKGRVVNISSIGGKLSQPLIGAYTASKFAMEAMSDAMRIELSRTGVKVVLIEPGAIATPIWEKSTSQEEASIAALPANTRARYEPMLRALAIVAGKMTKTAISPDKAAAVILKSLETSRPRSRYLVGPDARLLAFLKWCLPTRWMDFFLVKALGLFKQSSR